MSNTPDTNVGIYVEMNEIAKARAKYEMPKMDENPCYQTTMFKSGTKEPLAEVSASKNRNKSKIIYILITAFAVIILVGAVSACFAFAFVNISKLNAEIAAQEAPLIAENDSDEMSNSSYKRSMELNSSVLNEIIGETLNMRNSIDRLNQKFAVLNDLHEENQRLLNRSIDKLNQYELNQRILNRSIDRLNQYRLNRSIEYELNLIREMLNTSVDRSNQKFAALNDQNEENQRLLNRSIDKLNQYELNQRIFNRSIDRLNQYRLNRSIEYELNLIREMLNTSVDRSNQKFAALNDQNEENQRLLNRSIDKLNQYELNQRIFNRSIDRLNQYRLNRSIEELNQYELNLIREMLNTSIDRSNQKFAALNDQNEENQRLLNRSIVKLNQYEFNQHILNRSIYRLNQYRLNRSIEELNHYELNLNRSRIIREMLNTSIDRSNQKFVALNDQYEENQHLLNRSIDRLNQLSRNHSTLARRIEQLSESPGLHPSHPATSCAAILQFAPSSPSSQYWIRFPDGSVILTFCDMTRSCDGVTGGWMKVAELDTNQCPSALRLGTDCPIPTCVINTDGPNCSSVIFPSHGFNYSRVCGMIRAYQKGIVDSILNDGRIRAFATIDSNYVDGVSLTYGESPRQHIWTFGVGPRGIANS